MTKLSQLLQQAAGQYLLLILIIAIMGIQLWYFYFHRTTPSNDLNYKFLFLYNNFTLLLLLRCHLSFLVTPSVYRQLWANQSSRIIKVFPIQLKKYTEIDLVSKVVTLARTFPFQFLLQSMLYFV